MLLILENIVNQSFYSYSAACLSEFDLFAKYLPVSNCRIFAMGFQYPAIA